MADEFSDDFLDDDEIKAPESKPEASGGGGGGDKNKLWIILGVAVLQTVLAIVIVDQLVLPARAELLEANEELLIKVQQERLAIEKKIDELKRMKTGGGEAEEPTEAELTGLDASKQGAIHEIKDLIINGGGGGDSERLVLMNIGLEFNTEEIKSAMGSKEVIIRDRIINLIGNKAIDEIDENNEQVKLRAEIKKVLEPYLPEGGEIFNVYISNFLVQ